MSRFLGVAFIFIGYIYIVNVLKFAENPMPFLTALFPTGVAMFGTYGYIREWQKAGDTA